MTQLGIIHLASALYLSAIICLSVSINENVALGRIVRETLRRWLKFVVVALVLAVLVTVMDRF
jgi:hypothetical protein